MKPALGLATVVLSSGLVWGAGAPAHADVELCGSLPEEVVQTTGPNAVYAGLQVRQAQQGYDGRQTIAVVGAGIAGSRWLPKLAGGQSAAETADPTSTMAAGLAAGVAAGKRTDPLGVAPGSPVISVKVAGAVAGGEEVALTSEGVAAGIGAAARANADVIAVTVATTDSDELRSAVSDAVGKGRVVVASIGDRPTEEGDPGFDDYGTYDSDEDVETFPAAYDHVIGVGVSTSDAGYAPEMFLHSSHLDVTAPVTGTITTVPNGSSCQVDAPSPALATGEVAGLVALLGQQFPQDNPAQIEARLRETATGGSEPTRDDGFGQIQPLTAMTRELVLGKDGTIAESNQEIRATHNLTPPGPEDDPFFGFRSSIVWWAVLAGGGLLLAILVRPLLARRRG